MFKTIKTADEIQAEKDRAAKERCIAELKAFLRETDYVALPDYDGDKSEILTKRQAAREEIRSLK